MRYNKIFQVLPFGIIFILLLTFSDSVLAQKRKRQSSSPKISVAKIYKDIIGKAVTSISPEGTETRWTFEENEPREIQILQSKLAGDETYITIKMFTQGVVSRDGDIGRMRGNLRLRYERIAGGYLLTEVENLTFKYVVSNSSGRITNQGGNNMSAPSVMPLVSGAFTIGAGQSKSTRFVVPNRAIVSGRFRAPGNYNNVEVFIVDEDGYENFTKGYSVSPLYNSGKVAVGTVSVTLGAGVYYIVFSNVYSIITPKAVEADISIQNQ